MVVPVSRDQGCWSCGAGLPTTGYFSAGTFEPGYPGPALPQGHLVRATRHWFRGTDYSFVADDGTTVPLDQFQKFWCVASTGGP